MRAALPLLAGAALASCGSAGAIRPGFIGASAATDFSAPIASIEDRKFATVIRQRYDFSCGSAALATLMHYHYGDATTEETAFREMWRGGDQGKIRAQGFSLLDMKRYLEARGHKANGFKVTLAQVAEAKVPGIALVTVSGYRHFVVVKGVTNAEVLIGDPSLGLKVVSTATFQKSWNGIYFVLDTDVQTGRSTFNAPGQWASYVRAPVGNRFSDPVSLQALALTAPFYRDF